MANIIWHGKEFEQKIMQVNDNFLQKAALVVERRAKQIVLVLTGTLKRSILSNWSGSKRARSVRWPKTVKKVLGRTYQSEAGNTTIKRLKEGTAVVGTNVEYASHVEKKQSFLRKALELERDHIIRIFKGK